jgi:hypothetical protein
MHFFFEYVQCPLYFWQIFLFLGPVCLFVCLFISIYEKRRSRLTVARHVRRLPTKALTTREERQ